MKLCTQSNWHIVNKRSLFFLIIFICLNLDFKWYFSWRHFSPLSLTWKGSLPWARTAWFLPHPAFYYNSVCSYPLCWGQTRVLTLLGSQPLRTRAFPQQAVRAAPWKTGRRMPTRETLGLSGVCLTTEVESLWEDNVVMELCRGCVLEIMCVYVETISNCGKELCA